MPGGLEVAVLLRVDQRAGLRGLGVLLMQLYSLPSLVTLELQYHRAVTNEQRAVRAWLRGQRAAQHMQRAVRAASGARPSIAVAESLAALNAAQQMGIWPGPRSEISEREVEHVRRRGARIQNRARQAQNR